MQPLWKGVGIRLTCSFMSWCREVQFRFQVMSSALVVSGVSGSVG